MNETLDIDRTSWPAGPWDGEPDRVDFEHAGLPCLLHRGPPGAWCGYVAVSPGHPLHGVGYNGCTLPELCDDGWCGHAPDVDVHGGLTYSGLCAGHICHVPKPGEPDDVWWFGFDCGHAFDLTPRSLRFGGPLPDEVYRDLAYVRRETERLAEQLAAS